MSTALIQRHTDNQTMVPETVRAHTIFADISDDYLLMEQARWLTAEAYAPLANPALGLTIEDVYRVVSRDAYEGEGRAKTIAALYLDPNTGEREILGMVRVVIGAERQCDTGAQPLDAMNFVEPLGNWPHDENGLSDGQIAELGRFHIVEKCRTPIMRVGGLPAWLTRGIYEGAVEVVRERQVRTLYAIMPPYTTRLIRQAGIRIVEIPSRLKTDDEFAAGIFDDFCLYWRRSSPKLYEWPEAPSHSATNELESAPTREVSQQ